MKGKKLYYLINSLNRQERKQLFYALEQNQDKRNIPLKKILETKADNLKNFNIILTEIHKKELSTKSEKEQDKFVRRWLDFASKKIEDLKLLNYLKDDLENRNRLLTEIAQKKRQEELHEHYLTKTVTLAERNENNELKNWCLDWQINLYGQQQKDKNLKIIKELVSSKTDYINIVYNEQLSFFYRQLSNFHLDDSRLREGEAGNKPTNLKLDQLANESLNPIYSAEYIISKARFNFFEPIFITYLNEAKEYIDNLEIDEQSTKLLHRRIYFLKMASGFQRGEPLNELLIYSSKAIEIGLHFKYRDSFSFFYHQLFLILSNQIEEAERQQQENGTFFYTKNTKFYIDFNQGILFLKTEEINKAQKIFSNLTHSPNYYISLWSKLLELYIHYKSNNLFLCNSLIDRIKTYLNKNNHRLFTLNASKYVNKLLTQKIMRKGKEMTAPGFPIPPLHKFIIENI